MRRVFLVLLALLVLVPSTVRAAAWHQCQTEARKSCCCPKAAKARRDHRDDAGPASVPRVRVANCCAVTPTEAPRTSVQEIAPAPIQAPPVAVVVTIALPPPPPPPVRAPTPIVLVSTGPPEPAFVRNCAFLL